MPEDVALDTLTIIGWGALGIVVGGLASILVTLLTRILVRRRENVRILIRHMRLAMRIFLIVLGGGLAVMIATRPTAVAPAPAWRDGFRHGFIIVVIFAGAFLLTSLIKAVEASIVARRSGDSGDTVEETRTTAGSAPRPRSSCGS
ncbi:hypothetical protein G7085_16540 [Tessaracoccus sp. HDW20]|uniref:hypothetical protein n=1 Tax=Tessaracoccus coleopterorum TaxID=2714950 RepID=UPI0018D43233|nr:hypothetical protein [Tessaracoccus coleopterorum]NHB85660.1 hypothetical protein [Tessaracoccus coleopterorum]